MAKNDSETSGSGKKKLPRSFIVALNLLIGLPLVGILGWYFMTVVLDVSGSKQTAEGMIVDQVKNAKKAVVSRLIARAEKENFNLEDVEECVQIKDQYRLPLGYVYTDFSLRQLVGLPKSATDQQVQERCIIFAKAVERMEKMSHQDRHSFVCQGGQFTTDEAGRYILVPDPQGRGVIEIINGVKTLIEIPKFSHILLRQWQVLNLGDGCVVVGMSKVGVFSFSGAVTLTDGMQ